MDDKYMDVEYTVKIIVRQPEDVSTEMFGNVGDLITMRPNCELLCWETVNSEILAKPLPTAGRQE
ncbi:hypothetical protein Dxin01_00795 [Deinococcus xinjiangensis]|uniref:Uncharacterized protein n=1 Tax=Deinococcus xinjiangensis TaxID=457454 RepID=A0ABP9V709_9DEIO